MRVKRVQQHLAWRKQTRVRDDPGCILTLRDVRRTVGHENGEPDERECVRRVGRSEGKDVFMEREKVAQIRGQSALALVRFRLHRDFAGGFEKGYAQVVSGAQNHGVDVVYTRAIGKNDGIWREVSDFGLDFDRTCCRAV